MCSRFNKPGVSIIHLWPQAQNQCQQTFLHSFINHFCMSLFSQLPLIVQDHFWEPGLLETMSEEQPSASWKVWAPQLPKLSFPIIISSSVISHCDDTCKGNSRKLGT